MNRQTFVIIMAGGLGSRFWPLSREGNPKQFLDLLGTGKSMLRMTFERFSSKIEHSNIFVVTSEQYAGLVKDQLPELNEDQIISEPSRKNTAPCVLYTAFKLHNLHPDASMIVTPADHLILEKDDFLTTLDHGLQFLDQKPEALLTLGIQPTKPHTGYGYIQYEESPRRVKKVKTFTEKPSLEFAQQFLASGDFLWNSGIFLWKLSTIIKSFDNHLSKVHDLFIEVDYNSENEKEQLKAVYSQCQNISIDYAILEKDDNVYVIPSYFTWSDLGSWDALYQLESKAPNDNVANVENVIFRDSQSSIVHLSDKEKLVILQDVENLIVVDTNDVLLVCNKDAEQRIKEIVNSLNLKDLTQYL